MAVIGNTFDLERAQKSQAYAFKCWYNINFEGNTLRVSPENEKLLESTWQKELNNWIATANQDETAYDIPDDDFNDAYNLAKDGVKDKTGEDGKWSDDALRTNGSLVASGAAAVTGAVIDGALAASATAATASANAATCGALAGTTTVQAANQAQATAYAARQASEKFQAWQVAAPMSMAVGALYLLTRPNKEARNALVEMQAMLNAYDQQLKSGQLTLEDLGDIVLEQVELFQTTGEDSTSELEEKEERFQAATEIIAGIQTRLANGETLTAEDRGMYATALSDVETLGGELKHLLEESLESQEDVLSNIDSKQEDYDAQAEFIAKVQATADLAASFDEVTRTLAYVEAAAQTLNVATGTLSAVQAGIAAAASLGLNAYAWACVAMGTAGAVSSGIGVVEQLKWAGDISDEIEVRKNTQATLADSYNKYDEQMEIYSGYHDMVTEFSFEDVQALYDTVDSFEAPELPPETLPEEMGEETISPNTLGDENNNENSPFAPSNPFTTTATTDNATNTVVTPTENDASNSSTGNNPFKSKLFEV